MSCHAADPDAAPARQRFPAGISISIIVPCWREDAVPDEVAAGWLDHSAVHETIIAAFNANSSQTPAEPSRIRVVHCSRRGRGNQMNEGARVAAGNVLLFQHADTDLTDAHLESLRSAMATDATLAGGAFRRQFDQRHPHLRWLEPWEARRCRRFGPLFGDQSIFVRREVFEALGGFADIPLMEDVEFTNRLRRIGRIAVLAPSIRSSPRKHLQRGSWRTTLMNAFFLLLFFCGSSPSRLHALYYRADRRS